MIVSELIKLVSVKLRNKNIKSHLIDSEILLSKALRKTREEILIKYDTSVYTEESLHRLVEIYFSLGLYDEAKKYASTLGFNFPESDWYAKSYELVKDLS